MRTMICFEYLCVTACEIKAFFLWRVSLQLILKVFGKTLKAFEGAGF